MAYGDSQARGRIRAVVEGLTPQPQQLGIRAVSATYTTAHDNARSVNPLSKARETSRFLVGFINHCATTGTPVVCYSVSSIVPS